jgi:ABC-2 type transport system ATP-binding protein
MTTNQPAIQVENLTKRYGALTAVDNISFAVRQGELFAFLGPNGAGKSTTVEIIETIRTPTSGKVSILGMDVASHKHKIIPLIGVLPQGFNSFDRITVYESLKYYATLFAIKNPDIDALMALTNLKDKRNVLFKNLSGGLKQRLGIAIALVNDPQVIFLDEPTTGLDPHARREVWKVLQGLKARGKTIFLTTHYLEEAELLADTVAIISKGKIIQTGSPAQIIERNANYTSVTLKSPAPGVLQALTQAGLKPVESGDKLHLQVTSAREVQAILAAITDHNLPLPGLDVRKPNLEEVFLALTGEALAPETEPEQSAPAGGVTK